MLNNALLAICQRRFPKPVTKEIIRRLYLFYFIFCNQLNEEDKVKGHQLMTSLKKYAQRSGLPFPNVLHQVLINEERYPFIMENHHVWRNSLNFFVYGDEELELEFTDEEDRKEARKISLDYIAKELEFEFQIKTKQ